MITRLLFLFAFLMSAFTVSAEPRGTVRMVTQSPPPSLGLPFTANGSPSSFYWHALFDSLTEWSVGGQLVPALALSWEQRDPLTWAFELRPGVQFSNGEELDAEAVAATLNWLVQTTRGKSTLWGRDINTIARAEAPSPATVLIHTTRAEPLIPNKLSGVFIIHPSAFADNDALDAFVLHPMGTGPFKLETWRDGKGQTRMTFAPHAWRKPGFAEFILIPAPGAMARVQAVAIGDADLTANISAELLPVADAAGLTLYHIAMAAVSSFTFRTVDNPGSPVQDVRVRQALNYAINKDLMAVLTGGTSPQAGQGAPSHVYGYNPEIAPYPYDPDRARQLLAEAGYEDGVKISLTVNATAMTSTLLAQQIAQDVAAVGVDMNLVQTNGQQWLQQYTLSSFVTDLFNLTWNSAPLIDASRPLEYTSCLRARPFFCDESIVPLLEQAQIESDPEKRLALLRQAQARVHDLAPAIFLFESVVPAASGPRLKSVPWRLTVPAYDLMELVPDELMPE